MKAYEEPKLNFKCVFCDFSSSVGNQKIKKQIKETNKNQIFNTLTDT